MIRTITLAGRVIEYELEIKKVKNINLRVRPDGTVHVSANVLHSRRSIEALLQRNASAILRTIDRTREKREELAGFSELSRKQEGEKAAEIVGALCEKWYPVFSRWCGPMPEIRYRRMKTQWGNCRPKENRLTFNTRLAYVPERCAEAVVVHEFSHFVHADHSKAFYDVMARCLPDWKSRRKEIRSYEFIMRSTEKEEE